MSNSCSDVTLPSKSSISIHDNGKVLDLYRMFLNFSEKFRLDCMAKYITHSFRDTHWCRLYAGVTTMRYDVIPSPNSNIGARLENLRPLA
jgi:hypothetical protein